MATLNEFIEEWTSDADYVTAHTSGSTGIPKEIKLPKGDMIVSARATNQFFGISENSTLALPLSVDYIAGKMMVVRALEAGCRLVELPVSNEIVLPCDVDLLPVVPSQIASLLKNPGNSQRIRNLLIGGAPLPDTMANKLKANGYNAWLGYGMTETCSHVALQKVGESEYYTAMPNVHFRYDDRDCLVIISDKYSWKELITNDVVLLKNNREFKWLGRYDNVVISGGIKMHPEILERQIRELIPDMPPFYLVGEPDEKWGERLVMVVENTSINLEAKLKALLPDRRTMPKRIISVNELPKTANGGKIKRLIP